MRTIEKRCTQSLGLADTDSVPLGHLTDDLDVGVFVIQFGNPVEAATVDILVRILAQHVQRSAHTEFTTKNVGSLGADILTIGNISMG